MGQSAGQEALDQNSDQTDRYHRVVSQSQWVFEFTFDGLIHQNLKHGVVYKTPLPLLAILTHPEIAKDLEIVEFQQQQLDQQIESLEAACRRAKQENSLPLTDADQRERDILKILEPPIEKSIQTIRGLFLEDQVRRLKQIAIQLEINRRGLLWFLESKFGSEVGLTSDQKSQIRKRYLELAQDWTKQVDSQKKKSVDSVLSAASELTREKLKKAVGNEKNLYCTPLKILALQLDEQAISDFIRYEVDSQWPRYAGMTVPFSFEMNSLGDLVRTQPTDSPEDYDKLIPAFLMGYCLSNGELELVPIQKEAIAILRQQQRQSWTLQTQRYDEWFEANQTHVVPEALRKQFAREESKFRERFRKKMVQKIEDILLPHQQEVLTEFAARTKFTLHGPAAAILNSEPTDLDNQKRATSPVKPTEATNARSSLWSTIEHRGLKELAKREQEKINKLLITIERDMNQSLLKELSVEQKKRFDSMIGKPLKLECGNIELHLALAERPSDVWVSNGPIWMDEVQVDPKKIKPDDVDSPTVN
jgi:hypothetical protein